MLVLQSRSGAVADGTAGQQPEGGVPAEAQKPEQSYIVVMFRRKM